MIYIQLFRKIERSIACHSIQYIFDMGTKHSLPIDVDITQQRQNEYNQLFEILTNKFEDGHKLFIETTGLILLVHCENGIILNVDYLNLHGVYAELDIVRLHGYEIVKNQLFSKGKLHVRNRNELVNKIVEIQNFLMKYDEDLFMDA